MPQGTTASQARLLALLRQHYAAHGVMPSYDEMRDGMELRSKSSIHRLIVELAKRGHIARMPYHARAIRLTGGDISIADAASALLDRCDLSETTRAELRAVMATSP